MEYFIHKDILMLDIPKGAAEGVMISDLEPYADALSKVSLLIIRTGFGAVRFSDPVEYQNRGPYLDPDFCLWLNTEFPSVKCIGFDFLAVGSPANELGAISHQNLLGVNSEKFTTACEDMKLADVDITKLKKVMMAPWRIVGLDSSQVTVIAEMAD